MRILVDYRPALRQRTGVGEYIHELVRAYARRTDDDVCLFTSSWRDRPQTTLSADLGVTVIDRHIPVRVLNDLWHLAEWPPVEWLAGGSDVVHSAHPLRIPARRAAQVVTVHDLFFLRTPEATAREIRRDYPRLARTHARLAHAVVAVSEYTKQRCVEEFGVDPSRVHVCTSGAPRWTRLGRGPNVPDAGYVLFVGTLEPRKNLGTLLDAWQELQATTPSPARLVIAGALGAGSHDWMSRIGAPPLSRTVEYRGYVPDDERESLFEGARALVLPSLDEGFGLPVLEAMAAGVPVIASNAGALPEVTAGAAHLVAPTDVRGWIEALREVLTNTSHAMALAERGLLRARHYTWERSADNLRAAYQDAVARHRGEAGSR